MFLHIDLDCFFVSASRTLDKNLKHKPVAAASGNNYDIFGDFNKTRLILSPSYEARAFGVKTAMPAFMAYKLCPNLQLVNTDFSLYKKLSHSLHKILLNITNEVEKYSIDEYFVNLKGTKYDKNPMDLAINLKDKILKDLDLPCSIGLAKGKMMSKFATNIAKPDGIKFIKDVKEIDFLDISSFPGVGKSTSKYLASHGIFSIKDTLLAKDILLKIGKNGEKILNDLLCRNEDLIISNPIQKSYEISRSFKPVKNREEIKARILIICQYLGLEIFEKNLNPYCYELKIRYAGLKIKSFHKTLMLGFSQSLLEKTILEIFNENDEKNLDINYIGISLSNFSKDKSLFEIKEDKFKKLDESLLKIRSKYGVNLIKKASSYIDHK